MFILEHSSSSNSLAATAHLEGIMWLKQCHKPPMTENGNHSTYRNGDDWGMVHCFTHINGYYWWFMIVHGG